MFIKRLIKAIPWTYVVWGGRLDKVVKRTSEWEYRFYGLTFGQSSIGVMRRKKCQQKNQ